MNTFDKYLEGKECKPICTVLDRQHNPARIHYSKSDVQKAKQEAWKSWFEKHKRYCNFCEDKAMCKTAQLTEQEFGRME